VRFRSIKGADVLARMLEKGVNAPKTSSAGRLFDAACGLLGVKPIASFEGEAPIELERLAGLAPLGPEVDPTGWQLRDGVLDMLPLLARLADLDAERGAALFHGTLAAALASWVDWAVERSDCAMLRCAAEDAKALLATVQGHPLGQHAAIVGHCTDDPHHFVQMQTRFGGNRIIDWLAGEQLPRFC
jgi:hypothetical protein